MSPLFHARLPTTMKDFAIVPTLRPTAILVTGWPAGDQARPGRGIAGGEQRDLVALVDQSLGQVGHDTLGAAVQLRGNALEERGNLGDAHAEGPFA